MGNHYVSCGEVSSYKDGQLMVDKPWEEAIKVIRKAQVPVVPIYFHAKIVVYFTCYLKISTSSKLPSEF
jgi:hypothetical protein